MSPALQKIAMKENKVLLAFYWQETSAPLHLLRELHFLAGNDFRTKLMNNIQSLRNNLDSVIIEKNLTGNWFWPDPFQKAKKVARKPTKTYYTFLIQSSYFRQVPEAQMPFDKSKGKKWQLFVKEYNAGNSELTK